MLQDGTMTCRVSLPVEKVGTSMLSFCKPQIPCLQQGMGDSASWAEQCGSRSQTAKAATDDGTLAMLGEKVLQGWCVGVDTLA